MKKLPSNAEIVGINNRDLDTLKIDLDATNQIAPLIKGNIVVSESGINDYRDLNFVKDSINSVLVGTSLIASKDIDKKIDSLFKPKIKVCGITNLQDAQKAASLGADYLGFIFYKKSSRYVEPEVAKKIIRKIKEKNKKTKFVAVFVNSSLSEVKKISSNFGAGVISIKDLTELDSALEKIK